MWSWRIGESLKAAFELIIQSADVRRQKAVERKNFAFELREGCAFVPAWRIDEVKPSREILSSFIG
jgi:hypothetical protein